MDKTDLTNEVAHLFRISGHKVDTSVRINHREIDVRAEETQGLVRKVILVECADHQTPVGIEKLQKDVAKLESARETMRDSAHLMHVSRNGYSPDASGYAIDRGLATFSLESLTHRLVNFDAYIEAVERDKSREMIINEYQQTKIHFDERSRRQAKPAMDFLEEWLAGSSKWLTILGDYGVGKSWMLKRFLYLGVQKHRANPESFPLPFFVPLQRFTKAFDYRNLILGVFQLHGLAGVPYDAFEHLARSGKILFLFDSFDEMAQHLHRDTIRENLQELLVGISGESRAIMTSRPTYFEGRAERLVAIETDGVLAWHPLDRTAEERRAFLSDFVRRSLEASEFARLLDLSSSQRRRLFALVLGSKSKAYRTLIGLLDRFSELGSISQRAVIARLLTTVAETLSSDTEVRTVEGYPLVPDELQVLNQGKIFEIVVHNLLYRDERVGDINAGDRYRFLRSLAVYLQQEGRDPFAGPDEIRRIVGGLFRSHIRRSDTPEQLLEQYYRTCRRHSGLTTESQFADTTGRFDLPVEEADTTSRVGFSHNSLREYLVADALAEHLLNGSEYEKMNTVIITEAVAAFFVDLVVYMPDLSKKLAEGFGKCEDSKLKEKLFHLLFGLVSSDVENNIRYLGKPPELSNLDLTRLDFSGMPLRAARFTGSILPDTDLRKADLRDASFDGAVLDSTMLDGALVEGADFSCAEIEKIFVFDAYDSRTTAMLGGKKARQWLFSRGAKVRDHEELNLLLGRPWYEAAREVTRTLEQKIAGTHQDSSLPKGTDLAFRGFAEEFVKHLRKCGVLEDVRRSRHGSMIVRVARDHRSTITEFSGDGVIAPELQGFFDRYL
ncbi:MAG: NACHT domain-containing protein [Spirochaetaceae bacterium]|nr:NACHT domain-containing protein [Spirochaetaceae bacterium]